MIFTKEEVIEKVKDYLDVSLKIPKSAKSKITLELEDSLSFILEELNKDTIEIEKLSECPYCKNDLDSLWEYCPYCGNRKRL